MKLCLIATVLTLLWQDGADARSHQSLDVLVRELHRRNGDCEVVANNLDKLINWKVLNDWSNVSPAFIRDIMERVTGINFLDQSEMTRVMCRLTEADTLSGLRDAFKELGIASHLLTMSYNYLAVGLPYAIDNMEQSYQWASNDSIEAINATIEVLTLVMDSHLSGLDPEGTQWVMDTLFGGSPGRRSMRAPVPKERRTSEELCEDLAEAVNRCLALQGGSVMDVLQELFGNDIQDEDLVHHVVCEIAGISSVQEGIEVLENAGILDHLFTYFYRDMVVNLQYSKHRFEEMLEEADEAGDSEDVPSWVQRDREVAAMFLSVIEGLEEGGQLDLENDLVQD